MNTSEKAPCPLASRFLYTTFPDISRCRSRLRIVLSISTVILGREEEAMVEGGGKDISAPKCLHAFCFQQGAADGMACGAVRNPEKPRATCSVATPGFDCIAVMSKHPEQRKAVILCASAVFQEEITIELRLEGFAQRCRDDPRFDRTCSSTPMASPIQCLGIRKYRAECRGRVL